MTLAKPNLSPEDYLQLERAASSRSEYLRGVTFAMAGASGAHVLIVGNIVSEFNRQFRKRNCRVLSTDMRVRVQHTGLYTYPDVVALCGEPLYEDGLRDTLLNPALVVEVLSPSTEAYDRGDKFGHYRRLESVQDYLLVSQDRARVERFTRQPGGLWSYSEQDRLEEVILFEELGCELLLEDIYQKVDFFNRD
jgi:Uma2 family endonuclease